MVSLERRGWFLSACGSISLGTVLFWRGEEGEKKGEGRRLLWSVVEPHRGKGGVHQRVLLRGGVHVLGRRVRLRAGGEEKGGATASQTQAPAAGEKVPVESSPPGGPTLRPLAARVAGPVCSACVPPARTGPPGARLSRKQGVHRWWAAAAKLGGEGCCERERRRRARGRIECSRRAAPGSAARAAAGRARRG